MYHVLTRCCQYLQLLHIHTSPPGETHSGASAFTTLLADPFLSLKRCHTASRISRMLYGSFRILPVPSFHGLAGLFPIPRNIRGRPSRALTEHERERAGESLRTTTTGAVTLHTYCPWNHGKPRHPSPANKRGSSYDQSKGKVSTCPNGSLQPQLQGWRKVVSAVGEDWFHLKTLLSVSRMRSLNIIFR